MYYKVVCPNCGFEYELCSNDDSKELIEELESCPCGHKATITMEEEK